MLSKTKLVIFSLTSGVFLVFCACEATSGTGQPDDDDADEATDTDTETGTDGDSDGDSDSDSDTDTDDPCKVDGDEMDADAPEGADEAPPDSFDPDVQWQWAGDGALNQIIATPLVANLTDDDDNGEIDLCDIPDIVVIVYSGYISSEGYIYVLDGAEGTVHYSISDMVSSMGYPALGDVDGDGIPEIIALKLDTMNIPMVAVWEHDGTFKWEADLGFTTTWAAPALGDLDNDGDVEIVHENKILDHEGGLVLELAVGANASLTPTLADLDDDNDLEVIYGPSAYHHDGVEVYSHLGYTWLGHPHVGDIDADGLPEVLFTTSSGLSVFEHDGTITMSNQLSTQVFPGPAAIHDVNGDGQPELLIGGGATFTVFETNPIEILWSLNVSDSSGYAGATAFDFLGDEGAEAMYADEVYLFIYDSNGTVELQTPRASWTQFEYPVVADVDNDGSAEIVVISNAGYYSSTLPPLQVIRDAEERWVSARRIWNQHTYHVTNVKEDGTIPQFEPPNWETLNTFRIQHRLAEAPDAPILE